MNFKKGFTLIELLVVIGVLAVIAAGVVALIDPVDKNRSAQDAKVQSDIGQIATGLQAFVARSNDGLYPAAIGDIVTTGELTSIPLPPSGYGCANYGYTPNAGRTAATLSCPLRSRRYTAFPTWRWDSATGRACAWSGTQCQP